MRISTTVEPDPDCEQSHRLVVNGDVKIKGESFSIVNRVAEILNHQQPFIGECGEIAATILKAELSSQP